MSIKFDRDCADIYHQKSKWILWQTYPHNKHNTVQNICRKGVYMGEHCGFHLFVEDLPLHHTPVPPILTLTVYHIWNIISRLINFSLSPHFAENPNIQFPGISWLELRQILYIVHFVELNLQSLAQPGVCRESAAACCYFIHTYSRPPVYGWRFLGPWNLARFRLPVVHPTKLPWGGQLSGWSVVCKSTNPHTKHSYESTSGSSPLNIIRSMICLCDVLMTVW